MDDVMQVVRSILTDVDGIDDTNVQQRILASSLYRRGYLTMQSDTGKIVLSSYGEELLQKLTMLQATPVTTLN